MLRQPTAWSRQRTTFSQNCLLSSDWRRSAARATSSSWSQVQRWDGREAKSASAEGSTAKRLAHEGTAVETHVRLADTSALHGGRG